MTKGVIAQDIFEIVVVRQGMRAWPDQRHVALQNIQQLRQFVDTGRSQQPSDGRHPRVVARRLCDSRTILLDCHGPKFEYDKLPAIKTISMLPKYDRPGTIDLDRDRGEGHDRQEKYQRQASQNNVHDALNEALGSAKGCPLDFYSQHSLARRRRVIRQRSNAHIRQQAGSYGKALELISDQLNAANIAPRQRKQDLSAIMTPHKVSD